MSLIWPIFWLSGLLAAVISFFVAIFRQNSSKRAGAKLVKERQQALAAQTAPAEDFPTESFDFPEEPMPS